MEFFRIVTGSASEESIRQKITLQNLEDYTDLLFGIEDAKETSLPIGGLWGEFILTRSIVKGGLRFALEDCPNAFCWTITTGYSPKKDAIVVHATINRTQKHEEFIEEVNEFLDDHATHLKTLFAMKDSSPTQENALNKNSSLN